MTQNEKHEYALKNGEGAHIDFRGTKMTVKVSEEQSEGAYSLIEMVHPPNVGPSLHTHPRGAEAFYVLEGTYTIRCGQDLYAASVGDFIFIPKGIPHNYHSGACGAGCLFCHRPGWRIILPG